MFENEIEIDGHDKYAEPSFSLVEKINEIHISNLTYNDFFNQFMTKNVPILVTGISDSWECMNWVLDGASKTSLNNGINFEYLKQKIDVIQNVPVANCNKVYFNSHEKSEIRFDEFLIYWKQQIQTIGCESNDLLYLKDWHLRRNQPDYHFYKTPHYFASDWLNEYCEETNTDDYRFVYMGPKGTWTPFHADVFSSFSWSTNIVGTKKWIFFPPGQEDKLRDRLGNLPFDVNEEKHQQLIRDNCIRAFEVVQRAGQTVFVPSGWYHQVWNVEDTISVNHNWFNGCNIHCIWAAMFGKFQAVLREIDDCKDMDNFDEHCQLMLKSDFGLDFQMFLDILSCIAKNRFEIIHRNCDKIFNEHKLGRNHAVYDLKAIRRVVKDFHDKCPLENIQKNSRNLILQIDDALK